MEPLRSANIVMGQNIFTWSLFSCGSNQVTASNGVTCVVDTTLEQAPPMKDIVLLAGPRPDETELMRVRNWLRFHHRQGGRIHAVSSGVPVLAHTGLLDDKPCAAHWEDAPRLREDFPKITLTQSIFEMEERVSTCAGGAASSHMMLAYLARKLGKATALDVATRMVIDRMRDGRDSANVKPHIRYGTADKLLLRAISVMNCNIRDPLRVSKIAEETGVSVRRLERRFNAEFGIAPEKFYRQIRLSRARQLLLYSDHSLTEIAAFCGFGSTQTMKRHYECTYGVTPRIERKGGPLNSQYPGSPLSSSILHEVSASD